VENPALPDFEFDRSVAEEMKHVSSKFDLSYWRDISKQKRFPSEYWDALSISGLMGLLIDRRWGGKEMKLLDFCLAVEETAARFAGLGSYIYLSGTLVSKIISNCGTDIQKQRMLPELAKGNLKISIALSEEASGFDASAIETTAEKVSQDRFSINGSKAFVNNLDLADYVILFAKTSTSEKKNSSGITMFLVSAKENKKKIRASKLDKLGFDFVNNFDLEIRDLDANSSDILGKEGEAWRDVVQVFNMDRVGTSASLVGTGKLSLKCASDWAVNREVFGRKIATNQGIQFPLADAYAQLEAAENMTMKAASLFDQGKPFLNETNYALLSSSSAAFSATDRSLQTFGGHGYYSNYDVERFWRDVRVHRIHPISEELLLASIAERSLGLPKSY
jgi:acyl-CoA dehydrogenase